MHEIPSLTLADRRGYNVQPFKPYFMLRLRANLGARFEKYTYSSLV